ncbi:MAG TPA: hypothetical protein VLL48_14300 [Longimicrobiales bacterium]|nr:hypothetical protein [Longimicrobiales bacterium]
MSDATWADVDNDADLDLIVAAWGGASSLYRNDGAEGFRPIDADDLGDVVAFAPASRSPTWRETATSTST